MAKAERNREDQDILEYRDLMLPPDRYEDGFDIKTIIGAFFIGFVMMPGSIYLGLVAGQTMGPAAEWVTIILFTEVARRSFVTLKRQQIYMMYYVAGSLSGMMGGLALGGGPFAGLIWSQFLIRTGAAASFAKEIPNWVTPQPEQLTEIGRTFFHKDWLPAIGILVLTQILSRLSWFGGGYALFRVTSDYERLAFPMAPVAAMGAMALAESSSKDETWRWRVFSIGSMIGISFGALYIGLPTISGLVLVKPIHILPIPWIDFTQSIERFLPAATLGVTTSLGAILTGFVLPFWVVVGGFAAVVGTAIVNPVLYKTGVLHTWQPGMETISTQFANSLDFWLSFGIGIAVAIACDGFYRIVKALREGSSRNGEAPTRTWATPEGRGDFRIGIALGLYALSTLGYILLCRKLVPAFPLIFVIFFGFVYTPIESYINARMVGMTGQFFGIPYVRQATFILSGYKGVAIWFAPIPLGNYGSLAQKFRELELTGNRITSMVKAEVLTFPLIMVCSLLFWSYIWGLAEIPSVMYPYAQKFWHFIAMQECLWYSSTTEHGSTMFMEAIKPTIIGTGFATGIIGLVAFSLLRWPTLFIYGFIRGFGNMPHFLLPEIFGALLGRYYFEKRFGQKEWRQYAPVLAAGFACGMGLVSMIAIAGALVKQSIAQLPY
jgi:hypothetical protein